MSHVDLEPDDVGLLKRITGISASWRTFAALICCSIVVSVSIGRWWWRRGGPIRSCRSLMTTESASGLRSGSGRDHPRFAGACTASGYLHHWHTWGTIARQVLPVRNADGRVIAVLTKDAYWLAHERHRRRSHVFQDALVEFTAMVLHGDLSGVDELIVLRRARRHRVRRPDRRCLYMSGIAAEQYRHLGYRDSLVGRRLSEVRDGGQSVGGASAQ